MNLEPLTLRARYIFPVEGTPLRDACLTIERGRIGWIGPAEERAPDLDLGNTAILPGFVNAHTPLELARLGDSPSDGGAAEGGVETEDEVAWLKKVVRSRREGSLEILRENAKRNVRSCVEAGTTLVADTTTAGVSWYAVASSPLRGIVFAELIGLKRSRGLETYADAWTWVSSLNAQAQLAADCRTGLSPHAPYSTAGWLYHRAVASRLPLSTHLAEMPEELRILKTRDGPLRDFLEDLGAWDDEWEPISDHPADYVRKGGLRNADWILAHGNYFDPSDFWQFRPEAGPDGHRVAIAYCPRTHARFGHAPHPYRGLLERGAIVCLGTDSLASNPSLSVLDEIRFLHGRDGALSGDLLLTMATLFGAWALRAEASTGSLKVGKSADLALIALPDRDEEDPHNLVLESDRPVVGTVFKGDLVAGRWAESS